MAQKGAVAVAELASSFNQWSRLVQKPAKSSVIARLQARFGC
jgi:hypothetical protein